MPSDLTIKIQLGQTARIWFHSQFFVTPPYPIQSFAHQTIIVTGSNIGLGLEAARHFYRLNCAKLILAVRTVSKGEDAKEDIVRSVKHRTDSHVIEIWPLDLASTESTLAFAERVKKELSRVDILLENAGINTPNHSVSEGFERTMQVNVLNTLLLALSLLPKLAETKTEFPDSAPHLTIVSSEAHRFTKFPQVNAEDIYASLNEEKGFSGQEWYQISKLLEVLFIRELVSRLKSTNSAPPPVTINLVNPGLCVSNLVNERVTNFAIQAIVSFFFGILARTTEVGSRTLVLGACAGPASHGEFMSDGVNQNVEKWIYGDVGKEAQKRVFEQTLRILETRNPGVGSAVGV